MVFSSRVWSQPAIWHPLELRLNKVSPHEFSVTLGRGVKHVQHGNPAHGGHTNRALQQLTGCTKRAFCVWYTGSNIDVKRCEPCHALHFDRKAKGENMCSDSTSRTPLVDGFSILVVVFCSKFHLQFLNQSPIIYTKIFQMGGVFFRLLATVRNMVYEFHWAPKHSGVKGIYT